MERNHIRIVVGILLLGGVVTSFVARPTHIPVTPSQQTPAQKHAESAAAYGDRSEEPGASEGPAHEAAVKEIEAFLVRMPLILRGSDDKAVADLFDFQAMFDTVEQLYIPKSTKEQQEIRKGFRAGVQRGARQWHMIWHSSQVRNLRFLAGHHEAMVFSSHVDDEGIRIKMRWWMMRRDNVWRIYDFEDLYQGMRFSAILAQGMSAALNKGGKDAPWPSRLAGIRASAIAIDDGDYDTARADLTGLANAGFPCV